jgi:L-cysteate sulfo-lyase
VEGNLLLDRIFGAECRFISTERFYAEFDDVASEWADALSTQGERTYVINTLGRDTHSVAARSTWYVQGALELEEQFETLGWRPDVVYFCSGAATQAGLVLARKCLDSRIASSASPRARSSRQADGDRPGGDAGGAAARLDLTFQPDEITNEDGYIGNAYGHSPGVGGCLATGRPDGGIAARSHYTAKALAGLVDHHRQGRIRRDERVLFLHTAALRLCSSPGTKHSPKRSTTIDDDRLS